MISDAVVCRGGASTLAEINYFLKPAVVVPLKGAYAHQYDNTSVLVAKGCIFECREEDFSYENFRDKVIEILCNEQVRKRMVQAHGSVKLWSFPEEYAKKISSFF